MKIIIASIDMLIAIFVLSSVFTYFLYFIGSGLNAMLKSLYNSAYNLAISAKIQSVIFLTESSGIGKMDTLRLFATYNVVLMPFNALNNNTSLSQQCKCKELSRIITIDSRQYRVVINDE